MSDQPAEASPQPTAGDVVARFEQQYGTLDFLPLNPEILAVALAACLQDIGLAADNADAFHMLVDEENPVLPAEFLSLFATATIAGGEIDEEISEELAQLLIAEGLFTPHVVAPVPFISLMISMLASGARIAYANDQPEPASDMIDAAHELGVSLALQAPRLESGILSRRNSEFSQLPSVFLVFDEEEYRKVKHGLQVLHIMLTESENLQVPDGYDPTEAAEAVQSLNSELENFVLTDEDESEEDTLTDEEMARFLDDASSGSTGQQPGPDPEESETGFGIHPLDTSTRVIATAVTSDPALLELIPDDVDAVPVIAVQIEGHAAVETAWDMMKAAQTIGHSGGISPDFIANNPAHPTVLLHVWADQEDVDTSTDSPHHPPCIIIPLCISCHAETCSAMEETGWVVLVPQDHQNGIAITFHPEMFMKMELEAFRIASQSLID